MQEENNLTVMRKHLHLLFFQKKRIKIKFSVKFNEYVKKG